MIISNPGKSTTSRTLAAYAARLDRMPLYVDLDCGQGSVNVPGSIAVTQIDKSSINIEEGFNHSMPLIYFYGHASPRDNIDLYQSYVDILAANVKSRMDNDSDAKASGIIINTCGWVEGAGYDVILHIMKAFNVDVILVMNHDKLYSSLVTFMNEGVTVVKLPTSGGIVRRVSIDSLLFRTLMIVLVGSTKSSSRSKNRIKEYFYGKTHISHLALAPARIDIKLNTVKFVRLGGYLLTEGMRSMDDGSSSSNTGDSIMSLNII